MGEQWVDIRTRDGRQMVGKASLVPLRYSWAAVGGPEAATLEYTGPRQGLEEALTWLRCPVYIWDRQAGLVWWGYVHETQMEAGALSVGWSLERMANRVRVDYELADAFGGTGDPGLTDWAASAGSTALYGVKEMRARLSPTSVAGAEAYRTRLLGARAYPTLTAGVGSSADEPVYKVTLQCRGWWSTLSWKHYEQAPVNEINNRWPDGFVSVANSWDTAILAQKLSLAANQPFLAARLAVFSAERNLPDDPLVAQICPDSGDSPDLTNVLCSCTITTHGRINDPDRQLDVWKIYYYDLSPTRVSLSYGTPYWLVLGMHNGAEYTIHTQNHYMVGYSNTAYARGALRYAQNHGANPRGLAGSLPFALDAVWDLSSLVSDVVTNCGQFLSLGGTVPTGVYQHVSRDGTTDGLQEITMVMDTGTSNGRRLLSRVNSGRTVDFWEEEEKPAGGWHWIDAQGRIFSGVGNQVLPQTCPVGQWFWLRGEANLLAQEPAFLERSSYDCRSGRLELQFRDQPDPLGGGL